MLSADTIVRARSFLTFDPKFLDPVQSTGLWLCDTAEDVYRIVSGHRRRAAIEKLVKDKAHPREDLRLVPCMVRT